MTETRIPIECLVRVLLEVIPSDKTELREDLRKKCDSWFNIAPELGMNDEYWIPIKYILEEHITSFEEEWQKKVLLLYNSGGTNK